jgi:glycosyltransferase involved in cell wall biosynthesis
LFSACSQASVQGDTPQLGLGYDTVPAKKVLIAHQSTIPHYRVPFYRAVERLRPKWWEFSVIYDAGEAHRNFFLDSDRQPSDFTIQKSRTYHLRMGEKKLSVQLFPFSAWQYDLLVLGNEISNLSYPLSYFWHFGGKSIAYWGQGRDTSIERPAGIKNIAERAKIWLAHRADGFFAYTKSVHDYLVHNGVDEKKIYTLYNTIDIEKQRRAFYELIDQRDFLRKKEDLENKKVLLFVGRLNKRKNFDFLCETFLYLHQKDQKYHLLIIGGGDTSFVDYLQRACGRNSVSYHGIVSEEDIGYFYIVSDLYIFPGAVGLGPLQALCFDLTPVVIDSPIHNPEYEYLNKKNSLILPYQTSTQEYADTISQHLENREQWGKFRAQAWPSIRHLTIDNMATNFIQGINFILLKKE